MQIGRGGFATVYSADDRALGRKVAVKVLRHLDDDGVRRFQREARILANLGSHENLAVIHRFDETSGGNPCFIMEFVDGGTLADQLKRVGAIEAKLAISYARQVARALMHTHARGIVHRDIKPSNVLLTAEGRVKLSDFGIAVIRSMSATLNAATFEHAAPEVFLGGSPSNDERIDLYSLASTLYTLIDGASPYHLDGESSHEALLHRVLHAPIPVTDRARQLDGFWPKALAKDPNDRFQTAAELLTALTALGRKAPAPPGSARSDARPEAAAETPAARHEPDDRSGNGGTPPPPVGAPAGSPVGSPDVGSPLPPPPPATSVPAPAPAPTTAAAQPPRRQLTPHELVILDEAAGSTDVNRRRRVAELTTTQSVLFQLAQDNDDTTARTAVDRLTDLDLLAQLVDPQRPKRTRVLAASRITGGPLTKQLAVDPDPDVRAALATGVLDLEIFKQLIKDPAEKVRSAAFSHIRDPEVLHIIATSPQVEDRRAVAQHVKSKDLLVKLARDPEPSVRRAALARLDQRRVLELAASDDQAVSRSAMEFVSGVESLFHLTRHASVHVRNGALDRIAERAQVGGGSAEPKAVDALTRIADDLDHPQWEQAVDRVADQRVLARLARSDRHRVAERALGRIDDQMLLAELARDPAYPFRPQATARLTDQNVLDALTQDPDGEVASVANSSLARLRQRDEQLGTARVVMISLIVFAVAVTLMVNQVWPLAMLFISAVIVGHQFYTHTLERR